MKQSTTETLPAIAPHDLVAAAQWLVGRDTGSSSEYMLATALAGFAPAKKFYSTFPRDAHDLGRCIRLIECVPSVASALPALADSCPQWRALVQCWDELTRLYAETKDDEEHHWTLVTNAMDRIMESHTSTTQP